MKKIVATGMAVLMAAAMVPAIPVMADDPVSFTIFNSKNELQEVLEEAAAKYSEEHGVDIEVYYSSDTVAAHLSTRYASGSPYTLNMTECSASHSA